MRTWMRGPCDTGAERHGFLAAGITLLAIMASGSGAAAQLAEGVAISFDSLAGLKCEAGYKCVEANAEVVSDDVREGTGAVKTTWKSADDNYGLVKMIADIRVRGNFSKVPFKVVHYPKDDNWRWTDADPVLMLRRVGAQHRSESKQADLRKGAQR